MLAVATNSQGFWLVCKRGMSSASDGRGKMLPAAKLERARYRYSIKPSGL
jgi:hypothetical protein